jgi:dTDP-4-dehydrorhamnose 3,5-epimerase
VDVIETAIAGVFLLQPKKAADARGFFSETWRASALADRGIDHGWVQENHSRSLVKGTVRALHFQAPPHAQAKLLRVVSGAILDVVVDIRVGSPTYGRHVAVELSEDNWTQLYAPIGMAHGFCTLTDRADVLYKTSDYYAPASEGGLDWQDPDLGIAWPVSAGEATLTARDQAWPRLRDLRSPFSWQSR